MSVESRNGAQPVQIIVVGNEKGGSGKSTIAMHIVIALMKSGRCVASIDLDSRQKTFTSYIENRRAWANHIGRDLGIPNHFCLGETVNFPNAEDRAAGRQAFSEAVDALAQTHDLIVIDTPGHDSQLTRLAHMMADTLITPLNDSFVDFDVLAAVDPVTFGVIDSSHYSQMVEEARSQRQLLDRVRIDWIVLRNRLSATGTRNKRRVGGGLQDLSQRLNFRLVEGLVERVVFREFYPRGLTALDDLDEPTLGTRPTLSHLSARVEVDNLLSAIRLGETEKAREQIDHTRNAA